MLHYFNASSIEKSRRYLVIKGGGACLVALARRRGRQLRSRTGQQQRRSRGLAEEEGEETMNTMQTDAWRCMTWQVSKLGVPNRGSRWYRRRGKTSGKVFPVFYVFGQMNRRGESCDSDRLGMCGRRTGCVSGFVSSFWATFMYKVFPSELRFILY